jgi:hypothetical protein
MTTMTMSLTVLEVLQSAAISSSSSSPYTSSTSIMSYQNRYYNEYHEGLLEIAKGFFKSLSSHLVNKTMVAAVQENDSV